MFKKYPKKNQLFQIMFESHRTSKFEPWHDKTNKMSVRPAKTQSYQSLRCPHEETLGP